MTFIETGIIYNSNGVTALAQDRVYGVDSHATVMVDMTASSGTIKLIGEAVREVNGESITFTSVMDEYGENGVFIINLNKGIEYHFEVSGDFVGEGWAVLIAGGRYDQHDL